MKKYLSIFVLSFLFLSTNSALAVYNASDVIGQRDGSNNASYTTNTAAVTASGLSAYIRGIALDEVHHRLFISDGSNNRVLVYNLDSANKLIDTTADNVLGQPDMTSNTSLCTSMSGLAGPRGLSYDPLNNRLFVTMDGMTDYRTGHGVFVYDVASITDGEAAVNVLGRSTMASCANTSVYNAVNIMFPYGVAFDVETGLLYVSDLSHSRVVAFDARPAGSASTSFCGASATTGIADFMSASCVIGKANFTSSTSAPLSDTVMGNNSGVTIDYVHHRLFVSQYASNRITVYDISSLANGMAASYVIGQADFSTSAAGLTASTVNNVSSTSYDSVNNYLYASDELNRRVLVYKLDNIANGMSASYILGQDDFTTNTASLTQHGFGDKPGESYYDTTNQRLYVLEQAGARALVFQPTIAIQSSTLNSGKVTRSYSESITISDNQQTPSLELVSGTLPSGISISGTSLVGRAIEFGTYNFVLKAIDTGIHGIFSSDNTNFSIDIQYLPSTSGSTIMGSIPIEINNNDSSSKVCVAFSKTIKAGQKNDKDEVKLWQQFLNNSENENLVIDGGYGAKSKAAIVKFQKKNNLGSDGIIGPVTRLPANMILGCK